MLARAPQRSCPRNRTRVLADEAQHLRTIIREEKEASYAASAPGADAGGAGGTPGASAWVSPLGPDPGKLPPSELLQRAEATLAALSRERRRNAELVHRLQQLHGERIDVLELQRRYSELQEAHVAQAGALAEHEALADEARLLKQTVSDEP